MTWTIFGLFNLIIIGLLVFDLGVMQRKAHEIRPREALLTSAFWIALAFGFNALVYYHWTWIAPESLLSNRDAALQFLTGYLIEESLSVDNLFVFIVIFQYFAVPPHLHHRVLFWGVLGAIVTRAIFIILGAAVVQRFDWVLYVFGAFLLYTGFKLLRAGDAHIDPTKSPLVRFAKRHLPFVDSYEQGKFFIRKNGVPVATLLFLVVLVVEVTDITFATDSIPAIFGVTSDWTVVYTSNIFAILGLRSLYFVLANMVRKFRYLKIGLSGILMFIGVKLLGKDLIHVETVWTLGLVAAILLLSILASWILPDRNGNRIVRGS